jgi:hypothetical protein
LINAIFDGELDDAETETLPIFNLQMPKALAGLDSSVLDPRSSYDDPAEWEKRARHLGGLFVDNFEEIHRHRCWQRHLLPQGHRSTNPTKIKSQNKRRWPETSVFFMRYPTTEQRRYKSC